MTELNALMFEVVRRGYDIDEVNAHLATIERQRSAELDRAQAVIRQKDAEIERLHGLTADVEAVNQRRAEVDRMTLETSRKRETILEEASRAAREQTTLASKTAAALRADTEKEMSELRRRTEAEMAEFRNNTRLEMEAKVDEARAEARRIELDAREKSQQVETDTLKRLAEFESGHELDLQHRRSQADRNHSATLRIHRQAEAQLAARVAGLREMRDSLVATLTAIADGGLTAMGDATLHVPTSGPEGDADTLELTTAPDLEGTADEDTSDINTGDEDTADEDAPAEAPTAEEPHADDDPSADQDPATEEATVLDDSTHPTDDGQEALAGVDDIGQAEPVDTDAAMAAETVEIDAEDLAAAAATGAPSKWRLISTR